MNKVLPPDPILCKAGFLASVRMQDLRSIAASPYSCQIPGGRIAADPKRVAPCSSVGRQPGNSYVIICMRRQRLGGPAPQVRDPRVTDLRGADSWESRRYPAAAVYDANSLLFLMLFKDLENVDLSKSHV